MPQSLELFVESLWLPSSDAEHLMSALARNTEASMLSQACTAAQLLLGSDIVNTPPVKQSTVDANWFVPFLDEYEKRINKSTGLKHADNNLLVPFNLEIPSTSLLH